MGRTRTGIVRESSDELRLLLERYRETVYEPRVRFLLSLREDPRAKAEVLMGELGLSERTIRRWWHDYQKGGLETFLDERATMVTTAMEPEATYDDEAAPLMEFLNALPTSCSLQEWRDDVERALAAYLHGVYRVEVDIWQLASEMPPHPAPSAEDLCVPVEIPIGGDERLGTLRFYRTEESDLNRTQEQINELYPFLGFSTPTRSHGIARPRVRRTPTQSIS
jgi:transposase-like protein